MSFNVKITKTFNILSCTAHNTIKSEHHFSMLVISGSTGGTAVKITMIVSHVLLRGFRNAPRNHCLNTVRCAIRKYSDKSHA